VSGRPEGLHHIEALGGHPGPPLQLFTLGTFLSDLSVPRGSFRLVAAWFL